MSSSVSLFMTRILASIGFASGPSKACQVSLVTIPLSGRLAVAYTWVHALKCPVCQQQRQERCKRMRCSCRTHILSLQLSAVDSQPFTFNVSSTMSKFCSVICTRLVSAHVAVGPVEYKSRHDVRHCGVIPATIQNSMLLTVKICAAKICLQQPFAVWDAHAEHPSNCKTKCHW